MILRNRISLIAIIIAIFTISNTSYALEPMPKPEEISGQSAVLIENETGKILYDKDAKVKMYPASTTKIITGLLALEKLDLNKVITVPDDFEPVDGSSMYMLPEEQFTVEELIKGLLIHSANDASVLLGMEVSGTAEEFVKLMNQRAKEIGCTQTHFVNTHGLHDDNHYTTAYDMALIAREAMKNEKFREIVAQPNLILNETPKTPEKRIYNNTNRFLWSDSLIIYKNEYIPIKYSLIDGIKTGYTLEAQNCLVSSGVKNDMRLIAVVYKSNGFDVYRDSRHIFDYGFDNFKFKNIIKSTDVLGSEPVKHSVQGNLQYAVNQDISDVLKADEDGNYTTKVDLDEIKLPIQKGQKVGKVLITIGENSNEYDLVALSDVESIFTFKYAKSLFQNSLKIKIGVILTVLLLLIFIVMILRVKIRRKKRKNKYKRYRK